MFLNNILYATAISALAVAQVQAAETAAELPPELVDAGFVEDVGAGERINFSGKLRMLSQRIPSAACYAHAGIETEAAKAQLAAATTEFDKITSALEHGDETLNIKGAETDRRILKGLSVLQGVWDPLYPEIEDIIDNGGTDEEIVHIATVSHQMLKIAKKLVSEISNEYSNPTELLQADAMVIDIAGRQRMLAQRISKNVCLATSKLERETALSELDGARQMYDASVNALRFGMPDAGIKATKNPEIVSGLDEIIGIWNNVQPILTAVSSGEEVSDVQRGEIFNSMNALTGKMNTLVGMYAEESKQGL